MNVRVSEWWDQFKAASGASTKEKGGAPEGARRGNQDMLNVETSASDRKPKGNGAQSFFNTSEFEKKLRWKIENPSNAAERWRITPKMAEAMLVWNDRNRPAAPATVKKYAALMREGRWHYTGEAIIFSTQRLIDGQHRLAACVASGTPIEALVVFGAPDEAFAFIDVGKTRTAANIFAIHGVKNHAVMAAATQWVVGYWAERHADAAKASIGKGDHAWLYEQYLRHAGLQDSAWVANVFAKAKIVSPSMMVAIHYICARHSRSEADDFFRKVGEGIGFTGKKDPAYKLHKHFVDSAVAQQPVGRKIGAALTIKAWNAARRGRDVGVLRFGADETFPRAI